MGFMLGFISEFVGGLRNTILITFAIKGHSKGDSIFYMKSYHQTVDDRASTTDRNDLSLNVIYRMLYFRASAQLEYEHFCCDERAHSTPPKLRLVNVQMCLCSCLYCGFQSNFHNLYKTKLFQNKLADDFGWVAGTRGSGRCILFVDAI